MGKKSFNTGMIPLLALERNMNMQSMKLRGVGPYTFDYLYGMENATEENEYWGAYDAFF